ncbi:MAG: SOS response-associated peptidase [Burkholderiales bacterium]
MCGRYELHSHPAAIALAFGLGAAPPVAPRYNIAPMQQVPIVRVNAQGARELAFVRWGLVPRWAKDPSIGARMINARGETLKEKPAFRTAFRRHRCLVPADGFYEWKSRGDGTKQPMRIAMRDGTPFAFAGLTERWLGPDGEPLDTCVIVTTDANVLLRPVHDRMPVIVAAPDYARWLDPSVADPSDLVAPCAADRMTMHAVSTRVNNVRHDDASLIAPVATPAGPAEPPPTAAPGDDPGPTVPKRSRQSALF